MTSLLKEFEFRIAYKAILEAREKSIESKMKDWRHLKKLQSMFDKVVKLLATRISSLEDEFMEIAQKADSNKVKIEKALVEIQSKKGRASVSYKDALDHAMTLFNDKQKKAMNAYLETITKAPKVTQVIMIEDEALAKYLEQLKETDSEDLLDELNSLDKLPTSIKKKKVAEALEDGGKLAMKLKRSWDSVFKKAIKAMKAAEEAADVVLNLAQQEPEEDEDKMPMAA